MRSTRPNPQKRAKARLAHLEAIAASQSAKEEINKEEAQYDQKFTTFPSRTRIDWPRSEPTGVVVSKMPTDREKVKPFLDEGRRRQAEK